MSGRTADSYDGLGHERKNLFSRRLCPEHGEANNRTRKVVDNHDDPPAERPNLRQAKRKPRHPESGRRDRGHVHMPDVVGVSCCDDSSHLFRFNDFELGAVVEKFFLHDAPHGGRGEMQSRSGQDLSDSYLSHGWTQVLTPLDNIAELIGVLVDRLGKLEKFILIIGRSLHPTGNGLGFDLENPGGFGEIPSAVGFELQDG